MKTSHIRKPAVAGSFYPEDGADLHHLIQRFLNEGLAADHPPRAVIAPHAGYLFSGPIAGSAFAAWRDARDQVKRVVVMGPSHRVSFPGIALPEAEYFATPLGLVPVDEEGCARLGSFPFVRRSEQAHRHEHSVETHLPFLQEVLGEFQLVPLVIGDASSRDAAHVLNAFWDDPQTVFSISSDLSHYLSYDEARELDARTTRAIEENLPHDIGPEQACGRLGILGLMHLADRHALRAQALDVRNSGDTAGDRKSVVGYGAYAFG
ncbi:MAG TPA: AmmeMemoRadiSam system protein B [Kiritimatiellia bacterium]|nr:AmmeMemoRadiSam system protein B [Kiritimatiellia bacterium]